jgi:hypothetical protein
VHSPPVEEHEVNSDAFVAYSLLMNKAGTVYGSQSGLASTSTSTSPMMTMMSPQLPPFDAIASGPTKTTALPMMRGLFACELPSSTVLAVVLERRSQP